MTVITKPLSEKKPDKLDQPLVAAECLPHRDVEASAPVDPRVLVLRARARRASSVTTACLLMMALLVMCCGILGGFYLYKQFAHSQSQIARWQEEVMRNRSLAEKERIHNEILEREMIERQMMRRLKGWCQIPFAEQNMERFEEDPYFSESNRMNFELPQAAERTGYLNEQFDIDNDLEKITVPTFDGGRSSRFIHDFNTNKTAIIDVEAHRCFVMPLNRSQVLPPKDLMDLVRKMWAGYYEIDTDMVKETMRVVLPPITDPKSAGRYIELECAGYPIYKLEKIVSGVFKRSVSPDPTTFMSYAGKQYVLLKIANEDELAAYEAAHPRT